MKNPFYIYLLTLSLLFVFCKQEIKETEPIVSQTEQDYLINDLGDTIPTGVSLPAKRKWINPDSVAKPQTSPLKGKL